MLQVDLKKSPLKPILDTVIKNNWGVVQTNDDEGTREDDISVADVKPTPRGTTAAHLIKFINELLNIMDEVESLKGCYLVMDNASIHKPKPMIRS